jgi:hypothetical protein
VTTVIPAEGVNLDRILESTYSICHECRLKHGRYTKEVTAERPEAGVLIRELRDLIRAAGG